MSSKKRVGIPSPSMIVAIAALVVALGGTGYAAVVLAPNSVGTPQLKDEAVTSDKIAEEAVTGDEIAPGSLVAEHFKRGVLPKPPVIEAEKPLTLLHGWTAVEKENPPRYYRDPFGIVHLAGEMHGGTFNEAAFVLPNVYRPAQDVSQAVLGDFAEMSRPLAAPKNVLEINELIIRADGSTTVDASDGATALVVLDGVTFRSALPVTVTEAQCKAGGGISSDVGTGSLKFCANGKFSGIKIVG